MQPFRFTLIALHSEDGFISTLKVGVPWDLPLDRQQFRAYCHGKWLLVGRRTYEEMLGWFQPNQVPLVLSQRPLAESIRAGHSVVKSVSEAVSLARQSGVQELVCIGGAQTYAAALPFATHLRLTEVKMLLKEGLSFPTLDLGDWRCTLHEQHLADATHAHDYAFKHYERVPVAKVL